METRIILFDLDDTIYPKSSGIWSMIRERIDTFMIDNLGYDQNNVHSTRENFFKHYGTTLRGLESVHQIDPVEYLKFVHQIPLSEKIGPNSHLSTMLRKLPQKKVIFTNGDRWHAKRVTDLLEITDQFEMVIDILDISPYCKPMSEAFRITFDKLGNPQPQEILMIDDNIRNIQMADSLGMKTIWVNDQQDIDSEFIKRVDKLEDLLVKYPEFGYPVV
jgi:putative hydrolase of the HAD superfamily